MIFCTAVIKWPHCLFNFRRKLRNSSPLKRGNKQIGITNMSNLLHSTGLVTQCLVIIFTRFFKNIYRIANMY